MICEKRIPVPHQVRIRGMILEVCKSCLKYGEKLKVTEVDELIDHIPLIGVYSVERE